MIWAAVILLLATAVKRLSRQERRQENGQQHDRRDGELAPSADRLHIATVDGRVVCCEGR
jgi:hypothetical protein